LDSNLEFKEEIDGIGFNKHNYVNIEENEEDDDFDRI
jgi:hypothetical protein